MFINNLFINNKNLNSQLKYKIILINEIIGKKEFTIKRNIIYYSFTKNKWVIWNILTLKLYNIINGIDTVIFINITIKIIIE